MFSSLSCYSRHACGELVFKKMTWSKEAQTEVHFAMHMSLFDGKVIKKVFEHSTFSQWTLLSFKTIIYLSLWCLFCHLSNTAQAVCNAKWCKVTLIRMWIYFYSVKYLQALAEIRGRKTSTSSASELCVCFRCIKNKQRLVEESVRHLQDVNKTSTHLVQKAGH